MRKKRSNFAYKKFLSDLDECHFDGKKCFMQKRERANIGLDGGERMFKRQHEEASKYLLCDRAHIGSVRG